MSASDDEVRLVKLKERVLELIRLMHRLDEAVVANIDGAANLSDQTGIDSLQAFEAIITLHDLIDQEIPRDIDPSAIGTLNGIVDYLVRTYSWDVLDSIFTQDLGEFLEQRAEMADSL